MLKLFTFAVFGEYSQIPNLMAATHSKRVDPEARKDCEIGEMLKKQLKYSKRK